MATYYKGILGGFSGKVGPVVGARWRGKDVMRSAPTPTDKPATESQIEQRAKFKCVAQFLMPLRAVISLYFGEPYQDKSRYNLATSYHITEAVNVVDNEGVMNYTKVLISKGDIPGMQGPTLTAAANQELQLTWIDNSNQPMAAGTDDLLVVCYAPAQNWYEIFTPTDNREDAGATLTLPTYFQGIEVEVWGTFVNAAVSTAATSTYLGTATVL
ncbi:hypothetical protein SAMN05216480_1039 [Pustulibacterium marinum]|uniref:Uncharacterized protein n=1 Tax=Pustulibacterium marinum TaxID=1224947 RepID=A0A1I7FZY8_9FLAO|nr:DUF6266 family protein [Pustulibacterium marinum]SFU41764.1 hypothetical protein SAMN05216480_1039 [Pustulibacterium marinum]